MLPARKLNLQPKPPNSPKQSRKPKRKFSRCILDLAQNGKRMRSEQEAWEIVGKHKWLAKKIIREQELMEMVPRDLREDVEKIVAYSLFNSALRWNGRGSFASYACIRAKDCKRWVAPLAKSVKIDAKQYVLASRFFRMREDEPGLTLEEFAKKEGLRLGSIKTLRMAIEGMRGLKGCLEATRFDSPLESGKGMHKRRIPPLREREMVDALYGQIPSVEDEVSASESAARLRGILRETLGGRNSQILVLRYGLISGVPIKAKLLGRLFGVSEARISQIVHQSFRRLRKSPCAGELREHLEMLAKSPGN